MITNLFETFEKYADEYGHFERIVNPMHMRPDIHAFLLLSFLVPEPGKKIIRDYIHGAAWLNVDIVKLKKVASEEDVRDLVRCGVGIDGDDLGIFVDS